MVAKPLCPLYKYMIKPLDRAYYPELRYPMEIYRIVRFKASKKDRRIQWMEFKPALIGSAETKKRGYVAFTGHKYGNQSYLLEIPASEAEPGEYGIFYMSIITATAIPVGTFSINK